MTTQRIWPMLEANSHKIFKISQNFQTILKHILWRNKHKSHFVVFYHKLLTCNKGSWLFWLSSKMIFFKSLAEFYQISLKNWTYLTDFSPQLMACMYNWRNEPVSCTHFVQSAFRSVRHRHVLCSATILYVVGTPQDMTAHLKSQK